VRMSDSFVCMNGLLDRGQVSCKTSTNDAFVRKSDAFVLMNAALMSMNDAFVRTKRRSGVRCSELKAEDRRRESGDGRRESDGGSLRRTGPTEVHRKWGMQEESVCFLGVTVFKSSVFKFLDVVTRSTTSILSSLAESCGAR
jgi:hypothetical protein